MNAYPQDLREKIVEAVFERGIDKSETARAFGVSLSSVKRYAKAASEGETLAPKKKPSSKPKLDEQARRLLAADVEERPSLTLSERRNYLKVLTGVSVSKSTVCRELGWMEHTRNRGVKAGERDEFLRAAWRTGNAFNCSLDIAVVRSSAL